MGRVEDFHFRSAVDQKQFLGSHHKGNSQVVFRGFAIAHFLENLLSDGQEYVVSAFYVGVVPGPHFFGASFKLLFYLRTVTNEASSRFFGQRTRAQRRCLRSW